MNEPEETQIFVGVDVGGTNIKIGFVTDDGKIVLDGSIPTEPEKGPQDAIDRVAVEIDRLIGGSEFSNEDVVAVGLGTPGTMDIPAGMILEPPNLPAWRHFPVQQALSDATGKPVAYANDANAAAFGEYWIGSGQKYDSMVLLTLGTGVGGGIIVFNRTLDGSNSHGGEIGHIIVDASEQARLCSCGKRGHLEAYASATGVTQRATEAVENGRESSLKTLLKNQQPITALAICEHALAGDGLSEQIIIETADYLAIGILNVAHMIDPQAIVLGGAMNFGGEASPIGKKFIERIRDEANRLCLSVIADHMKIEFASLGGKAGFVGAAGIARTQFGRVARER